MCDYSLQTVKSRPAAIDDKLITHDFRTGSRGFCAIGEPHTAVCVLPGTELAFDAPIRIAYYAMNKQIEHKTAIFRQLNKDLPMVHHDVLELPNGEQLYLTHLAEGQTATVLQLPAVPKNATEAEEQRRAQVVA
jgi:hypothetical protein